MFIFEINVYVKNLNIEIITETFFGTKKIKKCSISLLQAK